MAVGLELARWPKLRVRFARRCATSFYFIRTLACSSLTGLGRYTRVTLLAPRSRQQQPGEKREMGPLRTAQRACAIMLDMVGILLFINLDE